MPKDLACCKKIINITKGIKIGGDDVPVQKRP